MPVCNNPYVHTQDIAAVTWPIAHGLNTYPIVEILIDDGNGGWMVMIPAEIHVIDMDHVEIQFTSARTGKAILI